MGRKYVLIMGKAFPCYKANDRHLAKLIFSTHYLVLSNKSN